MYLALSNRVTSRELVSNVYMEQLMNGEKSLLLILLFYV